MDKKLLDILACPLCHGELKYEPKNTLGPVLICEYDKLAFKIQEGIPVLLEEEAVSLEGK